MVAEIGGAPQPGIEPSDSQIRHSALCLQPDWVEDEAGDDDGGNARCDGHHACEGGFVERPLLDALCPLLQGLGCAEKADLLLEHRQRWLVMNRLVRLPVEG